MAKPNDSQSESGAEQALLGLEEEGVVYDDGAGAGRQTPTGPEVIQGYVKTLPDAPGVYRMLDTKGRVLYVGKARSLRKRVANYANLTGLTNRILRMILSTASMVFVRTETET
ncbi:MAG: excinuclease ABC subunit C, partial [Pseudomonadota bacterium]